MRRLLIWGAGDQGTVTLECALAMKRYEQIDFLEIKEKGSRQIPGYTIHREDDNLIPLLKIYDEVIVATGNNDLREAKHSILTGERIPAATVIHPTAVVSPSAVVGEGSAILAAAVLGVNASVGSGCIVNTGAIIEHDCVVEDFVNISPKAAMAGHTRIGRKSFLGIGCTIIDDITVGEETIVGAGAVVIRDVPDRTVAVGVPAKTVRQL